MGVPPYKFLLISSLILSSSESKLRMISVLWHLLRCVWWSRMWAVSVNALCELAKNVYSSIIGWSILYMPIRSRRFGVKFKYILPIFCLTVSISDRGLLKSPTTILDLSVSSCISIHFCLVYFEVLLQVHTHHGSYVFLDNWPLAHYLSDPFPYLWQLPLLWSLLCLKLFGKK